MLNREFLAKQVPMLDTENVVVLTETPKGVTVAVCDGTLVKRIYNVIAPDSKFPQIKAIYGAYGAPGSLGMPTVKLIKAKGLRLS